MSSAAKSYEVGAKVLGYYGLMASWRRNANPSSQFACAICITSAATSDDGVHEPAQSVTISGRIGLIALREAIDEALKEPDATGPQP